MFFRIKTEDTLKHKTQVFYDAYEWEKVKYVTFRYRVSWWKGIPREELIKPNCEAIRRPKKKVYRGKWANELSWYDEQLDPKPTKQVFRNRLNWGHPKEEAILIGEERDKVRKDKQQIQPQKIKAYVPQRKAPTVEDENNFLIKITYPKEVANVFRKEYVDMIDKLEWELTYTADKSEIVNMNKKIERLYEELSCFNSYNR